MKPFVTFIANYQLFIIIITIFHAKFTSHIFKSLIPFFRSYISWLQPQVSFTSLCPTQTLCQWSAVHIELIVKCQFFIFLDVLEWENTNANFPQNVPFLRNTIRFTGVINKPCMITFISGINNLSFWGLHQISARRVAVLLYSGSTFFTICGKDFTNILHDEITSVDFFSCKQPPSFSWGWFGINTRVLMFLELSVLAHLATITRFIITLSRHHSVQTSLATIVWDIVELVKSFVFRFGPAITRLNFITFGGFPLPFKVNIFFNESEEFETVSEIF